MIEIINALSERLENQAVKIAKLNDELAAEKARSTKLRKWWDDETEKADRLETQSVEQGKEIDGLLSERQSWEYERATLLGQVKDLEGKLDGDGYAAQHGSVEQEVAAIIARRDKNEQT